MCLVDILIQKIMDIRYPLSGPARICCVGRIGRVLFQMIDISL